MSTELYTVDSQTTASCT